MERNITLSAIAEGTQNNSIEYQNKTQKLNNINNIISIIIIIILILIALTISYKIYRGYSRR